MGFFDQEIESKSAPTGEYSGPSIEVIPAGTQLLAYIENAEIAHHDGSEYVSLQWRINKPATYANRVIFQKLRIWEVDNKKRQRALQMLAAIDHNAGGVIAKQSKAPDSALLAMALPNKPMLIKLDVWEMDGKSGNWICAVAPKPHGETVAPQSPSATVNTGDIPF